ncbi:TPA: hypothetical protein P1K35_000894 [Providencia rettgeri]|uniref:hypothetical protein n=1 Tax=Providencia sp. PROV129 TaxID=2949839 RepID=UPI00234A7DB1|nr:hypothetical protein [Providencia sp. PROV129]
MTFKQTFKDYKKRTLYCFINIEIPYIAWEVAIGRICTTIYGGIEGSSITPMQTYSALSVWQYNKLHSLIVRSDKRPYENELKMEKFRHDNFRNKVSRLKGLYFFESKENAIKIRNHLRWNWLRDEDLAEVDFYYKEDEHISFYDSLWIDSEMSEESMNGYFSGKTRFESPATEILAYGKGVIKNDELVCKARNKILNLYPKSIDIIDSAKLIFDTYFKGSIWAQETDFSAYNPAYSMFWFHQDENGKAKISSIMNTHPFEKYGFLHRSDDVLFPDFQQYFLNFTEPQFEEFKKISNEILLITLN